MLAAGPLVMRLADSLVRGDLIFIAADEQRAELVAELLRCAAPRACVIHVPSSDALPGDRSPPSPANAGRRVAALRRLRAVQAEKERPVIALISTAEATARLTPPPAAFDASPPILKIGDPLDISALEQELLEAGYVADDRVDEPGELAVRGQVVDIFPADAGVPARIAIADGKIAEIRRYDPVSQRGEDLLDRLEVGRANEPLDLPTASLLEHLPKAALALDAEVASRRERAMALCRDSGTSNVEGRPRGLSEGGDAAPLPLALPCEDALWTEQVRERPIIDVAKATEVEIPRFVEQKAPLRALGRLMRPHLAEGGRFLLAGGDRDLRFLSRRVAKSLGVELRTIEGWTEARALDRGQAAMILLPVERGWKDEDLVVVAAADLLGGRALTGVEAAANLDPLAELGELRRGDVVVHEDYGVGVIAGIEPLPGAAGTAGGDAIRVDYAGGASRLVPTADADRIWRYGAAADAVTLDKLDGSSWNRRRADIDEAIAASARALAAMAAERTERRLQPIMTDDAAYERFSAGFPFTETPDQARAISALRADLARDRPMDRLIIGDVGYGKTEVALRAAALVALGGRQVAIAAPTTVLVRQHFESFSRRFAESGIRVEALSRLSTAAEKKAVRSGLADGSIDIVIGTGAIAAKGIAYRRLGLVIVDEEQRFGAADKARLRGLADVHFLALSATPIPRTLQMALVGLQDLSLITTPPARRQPIRTSLSEYDPVLVRAALMREKSRGGQSFVVVPRIEDMPRLATELARLVPELRVVQAHGKMRAVEMDAAMVDFARGEGDVLLATNIIEAGLDVPRANTMIVWRADRFGLSQLHQLRGRVGRGGRRGQILLLTDPAHPVAEATRKRLRTLQAFDRLGAGFAISARDLDLRGAGDLLGDEQAGHVKLIGVDLYQHLLARALRQARGEPEDTSSPDLDLGLNGRFPDDWIPDEDIRIGLYVRLARLSDTEALDAFEEELEDRFGPLPDDGARLLLSHHVRLLAKAAGIQRVVAGPAAIALEPGPGSSEVLRQSGFLEKRGRYLIEEAIADPVARIARVRAILEAMES